MRLRRRLMAIAGIMVASWALMLLMLALAELFIAPIPQLAPGWWGSAMTGALKALMAGLLAVVWLKAWHEMARRYRERALRRLSALGTRRP